MVCCELVWYVTSVVRGCGQVKGVVRCEAQADERDATPTTQGLSPTAEQAASDVQKKRREGRKRSQQATEGGKRSQTSPPSADVEAGGKRARSGASDDDQAREREAESLVDMWIQARCLLVFGLGGDAVLEDSL